MRTVSEIKKEIEQEKERAAARVAELQAKQVENRKHLEQINEQYLSVLAGGADDEEVAILQEQVEAAERTIKLTDDAIRSLSKGTPRIQQLEAERFALLISESKELEQKAAAIHGSLKEHHDALAAGIVELNALYHEWYRLTHIAGRILQQFDGAQKEKLGLPINLADRNPVADLLNSLLIERSQAFSRR